ncbi:unnamed protein product [Schistosoma curassoni]|uniref:Vinculin n=1 Tax=Schistosoma curassoni TaxID=6186 RepID=A0A183JP43_9TREM|nr:unnamed protein product [Schistosoma curassoni]
MDNDGGGRDDDEQSHWITSCSSRLYYYYKSHLYTTVYFLDYVPTVELLTSSRDIATALRSVFLSAGKVQGRPSLDPVYDEVRSNAQVVISNVGQLLQTLKSVEEDERRGIRSLELAANYCREQAKLLPSSKDPEGLLTPNSSRKSGPRSISVASGSSSLIARYLAPDDLARAAGGPVQSAVSKAILANNTQIQRDIVQTSSATRDAVTDLVAAAKVRV